MEVSKVSRVLGALAPLRLAEKWDNVGLLVDASKFSLPSCVRTIFLTNDLTSTTFEEALSIQQDKKKNDSEAGMLIVSYHPPLFSAIKSITHRDPKQSIFIRSIQNEISIYSPHTALDAVSGGVNDWLAQGLGEAHSVNVLEKKNEEGDNKARHKVVLQAEKQHSSTIKHLLLDAGAAFDHSFISYPVSKESIEDSSDEVRIEAFCSQSSLPAVVSAIKEFSPNYPIEISTMFQDLPSPMTGQGRLVELSAECELSELVERVKAHLKLSHVRLAVGIGKSLSHPVKRVALCPGSGASVITRAKSADVYLTGEMSHHQVIASIENGVSVILTEHSNCERGYLEDYKKKIENAMEQEGAEQLDILISQTDADPLSVF